MTSVVRVVCCAYWVDVMHKGKKVCRVNIPKDVLSRSDVIDIVKEVVWEIDRSLQFVTPPSTTEPT